MAHYVGTPIPTFPDQGGRSFFYEARRLTIGGIQTLEEF
jgi:hypothetical protein